MSIRSPRSFLFVTAEDTLFAYVSDSKHLRFDEQVIIHR